MTKDSRDLIPAGHTFVKDNILEKGNLFGAPATIRTEWAKNLNLPRRGDCILFGGCGYHFMKYGEQMMSAVKGFEKAGVGMDRLVGVTKAFGKVGIDIAGIYGKMVTAKEHDAYTRVMVSTVNVLRKLGVEFAYLQEQEPCCGSPLYYYGFEDDYATNASRTYDQLRSLGVRKVIGLVPACINTLRNLYPKYVDGYRLEASHFIEVVAQRLKETGIRPKLKKKMRVTFHDPCQLSRYLGITNEPRYVMEKIDGLELREVPVTSREWSSCCGGGGLEMANPELSERIATQRVRELLQTEAQVITTSCPGCVMQLTKGVKKANADVRVLDLAEVLDMALEGE